MLDMNSQIINKSQGNGPIKRVIKFWETELQKRSVSVNETTTIEEFISAVSKKLSLDSNTISIQIKAIAGGPNVDQEGI